MRPPPCLREIQADVRALSKVVLSEQLQTQDIEVDLSRTTVSEILGSTFAHCSQLERLSLANKSAAIGRDAVF